MIPSTAKPKEIKSKFLENNPKYKELDDAYTSLGEFSSINEDDEVWLMQCPRGASISLLKDHKIKFPGRSNCDDFETVATEYPEPIPHAFGHKNKKAHCAVKIVPVRGSIVMRNRLKAMPPPDASASDVSPTKVPMPRGIKERHPLHGVDFQRKLEISPQIAERLKQVCDLPTETNKSKKKSKNKSFTIPMDSDGEVELVLQKKPKHKKKKRKNSDGDEDNEVPTKKKGKKNNKVEEVADDLQWIQML